MVFIKDGSKEAIIFNQPVVLTNEAFLVWRYFRVLFLLRNMVDLQVDPDFWLTTVKVVNDEPVGLFSWLDLHQSLFLTACLSCCINYVLHSTICIQSSNNIWYEICLNFGGESSFKHGRLWIVVSFDLHLFATGRRVSSVTYICWYFRQRCRSNPIDAWLIIKLVFKWNI